MASPSGSVPMGHKGVVMGTDGRLRIVEVAEVGEDAILVHDATRDDPGLAFALARLSVEEHNATTFGVFRSVDRPDYGMGIGRQLAEASEKRGPGDLATLLAQQRNLGRQLARTGPRVPSSHGPALGTLNDLGAKGSRRPAMVLDVGAQIT
jgi:hypothetical protein